MIDVSPQDITTIKRILAKLLPECEIRAFGSRVSWTAKPHSDLDIIIVGRDKIPRKVLALIKSEFEESAIPITVDVLDWHRISAEFRENIEKEYEIIQTPEERNSIPDSWTFKKISEIAEVVGGGTPSTKKSVYWNGDIPWLTPKDLSGEHSRYVARGERNITRSGLNNSSARLVPPKTVLLTSRAPVGYVALAKTPMATNQGFRSIIVNDEHDPDFIYYLLVHNTGYLKQHAAGSTFQELSGSTLKSLEFLVPPHQEQRTIAYILGSLDDKIELNRRMNKTLEAMARAIFISWFVDFDPVRAKAEGRDTCLPDEIAELFPDSFQDSELGEIPNGWNDTTLKDGIEIFDSVRIPLNKRERAERQGPYPYYGAAGIMDHVDDFLFDGVYVLTGEDGSVADDDGYPVVQYIWGQFWVNNHAHVLKGKNGVSEEHLYLFLQQTNIAAFVTGAVQPKLNQNNLKAIPFVLPKEPVCTAFSELIQPLFTKVRANVDESVILASLRETLLPKLISGEMRVTDAEKFLEEAT